MDFREIFQALIVIKNPGFVDLEYEINADNPMPGGCAETGSRVFRHSREAGFVVSTAGSSG
jgi:hypothetical protein